LLYFRTCYIFNFESQMNNIRLQLKIKGISLNDVARQIGHHRVSVSNTLRRKQFSPAIQDHVARLLNADPRELWGVDYYQTRKQSAGN
jgi:lambda repressor-like predicted transcriptional regulator